MTIHRGTGLDHQALNTSAVIIYDILNCSLARHLQNNTGVSEDETFAWVSSYIDLVIHFLGMLGNLLSLLILYRHRICGKRMSQLLLWLTVAEIAYTGLAFFSEFLQHSTTGSRHAGLIYLEVSIRIAAHAFLSQRNWWVVVISGARYLVVSRPLKMKKSQIYTRLGFNILFLFFLLFWTLESVALTFLFRVLVVTCSDTGATSILVWALHNARFLYRLTEGLVVFLRTVLPSLLVSTFSALTLLKLYRGSSIRQQRLSAVTRTITLLTITFVLLELPYGLTFIFCFVDTAPDTVSARAFTYYSGVGQMLVALDSLCNTVIYCVSSESYKRALMALLCCRECTAPREQLRVCAPPTTCNNIDHDHHQHHCHNNHRQGNNHEMIIQSELPTSHPPTEPLVGLTSQSVSTEKHLIAAYSEGKRCGVEEEDSCLCNDFIEEEEEFS